MDIFTKEKRSKIMSCIKSKNTKPEIALRKALFNKGFRYTIHPKNMEGNPDIYMKKHNAVIFFNGCFWHGHTCKISALPKTRTDFWKRKIEGNKLRDLKILENLRLKGYRVLIIWGCSFKGKGKTRFFKVIDKTIQWIASSSYRGEISNNCFEQLK